MKIKNKFVMAIMLLTLLFCIFGCAGEKVVNVLEENKEPEYISESKSIETFVITESVWGYPNKDSSDKYYTYENLNVDDLISDTVFGKIKVIEVSEDYITLGFEGGFVERKGKGDGINLSAEPLTEFKVTHGQTVMFASQTMDAGVTVTFTFN